MNRGNLQVTLNLADNSEVEISCFIQVVNPDDEDEVHNKVMDTISDYLDKYDNSFVYGEAELHFENYAMYKVVFGHSEGEDKWGMGAAGENVTLH